MLALFKRTRKRFEPRRYAIPRGMRVYAIGDVHGRMDLLLDLIARIRADDRVRGPAETGLIMLGDLIDRGPESAQVLEYLIRGGPGFAWTRYLMGNHEDAFLTSVNDDSVAADWLRYGGLETLESYGVTPAALINRGIELATEMDEKIPLRHYNFVRRFEDYVQIGDYLFVHAGIRPGIPIERQKRRDLYWIRKDFLSDQTDHGLIVVHGHTISERPEVRDNRIGIDTGAYCSNRLTALGLEDDLQWFLSSDEN